MKTFRLKILSADEPMFDGDCVSLELSTNDGRYGIMADHSNTVMAVVPGIIRFVKESGSTEYLSVDDGIIVVEGKTVTVLVDTAERPEEVDKNKAKKEYEKALRISRHAKSNKEYDAAAAKIARELMRIKLSGYDPKL